MPFDTHFVRVVNAPHDPAAFRAHNFRLIVSLFDEFAFTHGPLPPNNSNIDPDRIAAPVEVTMDDLSAYLAPDLSGDTQSAGFSNPCALRIDLRNTSTGDSIGLYLDNDGPVVPGDYPVANLGIHVSQGPEEHPGEVIAGFVMGKNNPDAQGYRQQFGPLGGVLSIDQVTPRWITGTARIAGIRTKDGEWDDGFHAYPAGLANREIQVEFSLKHTPPLGLGSVLDTQKCLPGA